MDVARQLEDERLTAKGGKKMGLTTYMRQDALKVTRKCATSSADG
jgi:hypothetical protein